MGISSVHCGDPVNMKMGFQSWQGDKQAMVILSRDPAEPVQMIILDVKNGEVKLKWPDLEKKGGYFGGAKAYLGDIQGSWEEKWNKQVYFFDVIVDNKQKQSDQILVDPLPPQGQQTKSPSVPIVQNHRKHGAYYEQVLGKKRLPKRFDPNPYKEKAFPMGKFDIKFDQGEVLITVAVELHTLHWSIPANFSQRFKERVEGFWNGPNGFGGFALHRKSCVRGDDCDCRIVYNNQNQVVSGGCCKIPIRLDVEISYRHGLVFDVYKRGPDPEKAYAPIRWGPGVDPAKSCGRVNWPENRQNTWAHEIGHCLGFPDQYLGGHLWDHKVSALKKGFLKKKFPVSMDSIMGINQSRASEDHLHFVEEYMGNDYKIIRELVNRNN